MERLPSDPSLPEVREKAIERLTEAFATELVTMDELEDRIEEVYRARSIAAVQSILEPLRERQSSGSVAVHDDHARARERVRSVLGSTTRRGLWVVPRHLDVLAVFSDTTLDLTAAPMPGDLIDIHVRAFGASLRIVVPDNLRVVNRIGALFANIEIDSALELAPMVAGSPVIRLTGHATAANVEIVAAARRAGSD